MDKRKPAKIIRIKEESKTIRTFTFSASLSIKPGQFIMITDYENGEKPFSVSDCFSHSFSVTVKRVGDFTSRMFELKEGDTIYYRGAYGKSFVLKGIGGKKVLIIAGGCGSAPLRYLTRILKEQHCDITVLNGAKNKDELIFVKDYKFMGINTLHTTDDGSYGEKGTVVDILPSLIANNNYDVIFTAGPEMMMKGVLEIIKNLDIQAQFLLERYMKCATGLCGQCTLDPIGIRLCEEGPVLDKEIMKQLTEFGSYTRDSSGQRVSFH